MKNILNTKNWQLPKFEVTEFHKKRSTYCICIPEINEGEKFKTQIKKMKKYAQNTDIIILDGGSKDGSTNKTFLKQNGVRSLLVKKSPGKQGTQLRMGFSYALKEGYEGIITIDGNGKDGIDAIPLFLNSLAQGYDCVAGSRFIEKGKHKNTPFGRYIGIRFFGSPLLSLAAMHWLTDVTNGFMGYSKNYLLHPKVQPFRNIFVKYELLFYLDIRAAQLDLKINEIPVTRQYPKNIIPTKITGIKGNFDVFKTFVKVAAGYYNPR